MLSPTNLELHIITGEGYYSTGKNILLVGDNTNKGIKALFIGNNINKGVKIINGKVTILNKNSLYGVRGL